MGSLLRALRSAIRRAADAYVDATGGGGFIAHTLDGYDGDAINRWSTTNRWSVVVLLSGWRGRGQQQRSEQR